MKRLFCMLLILALALGSLTACDRQSTASSVEPTQSAAFAPETTAVASGEAQPAESADAASAAPAEAAENAATQPVVEDSAATEAPIAVDATAEPAAGETAQASQPFATATPQPNTAISGYSEVAASGLGFRFSYPNGWTNIPGRSTVCYVQPLEDGTVYPARVAVTMKKLAHKCNANSTNEHTQELASYVKNLMTQYDEATFEVNTTLDEETKFMGNSAISTTYLAYDGSQEIQGYVILTYFERYLFVFHFLCAYEDYDAFQTAMCYMRDSVQPDQTLLDN